MWLFLIGLSGRTRVAEEIVLEYEHYQPRGAIQLRDTRHHSTLIFPSDLKINDAVLHTPIPCTLDSLREGLRSTGAGGDRHGIMRLPCIFWNRAVIMFILYPFNLVLPPQLWLSILTQHEREVEERNQLYVN